MLSKILDTLKNFFNSFLGNFFKKEFKAKEFGIWLKELRESKKMSLRRVAKLSLKSGVEFSYGYVHRLEKGLIKNPDVELVSSVLNALEVGSQEEIRSILKSYNLD
jgi:transcriptional regulator with XRE-family HTH domain